MRYFDSVTEALVKSDERGNTLFDLLGLSGNGYIIKFSIIILLSLSISLGCENRKKDEYKFIEYVEVEGNCYEDHVGQSAIYKGDIVHWYNITKNVHSIYGSVNLSEMSVNKMIERINDPYKYYPPFIIEFSDLSQQDIDKDELHIKGISLHSGKNQNSEGPRYRATCNLKVTRRLNYLP